MMDNLDSSRELWAKGEEARLAEEDSKNKKGLNFHQFYHRPSSV